MKGLNMSLDCNGYKLHVGDLVECVESSVQSYGLEKRPEPYTITQVEESDDSMSIIYVTGLSTGFWALRFRLIKSTVIEEKPEILVRTNTFARILEI